MSKILKKKIHDSQIPKLPKIKEKINLDLIEQRPKKHKRNSSAKLKKSASKQVLKDFITPSGFSLKTSIFKDFQEDTPDFL